MSRFLWFTVYNSTAYRWCRDVFYPTFANVFFLITLTFSTRYWHFYSLMNVFYTYQRWANYTNICNWITNYKLQWCRVIKLQITNYYRHNGEIAKLQISNCKLLQITNYKFRFNSLQVCSMVFYGNKVSHLGQNSHYQLSVFNELLSILAAHDQKHVIFLCRMRRVVVRQRLRWPDLTRRWFNVEISVSSLIANRLYTLRDTARIIINSAAQRAGNGHRQRICLNVAIVYKGELIGFKPLSRPGEPEPRGCRNGFCKVDFLVFETYKNLKSANFRFLRFS